MGRKRWVLHSFDRAAANALSESGQFSGLLSVLLAGRGFDDPQAAIAYINGTDAFEDPFSFADMDKAAKRVEAAIENFERIAVYGDYDADGVTATAVLYSYLCARDADVRYYIPQREGEGYGLNKESVAALHEDGVKLLITVDNGVSAHEEIDYANSLGMDVVVTDHHTPGDVLPNACAVVNPHRADCPSRFHDYAGVGVAFKLVQALEGGEPEGLLDEYADLVAIGTMGDVVPLKGENRALVQRGLLHLSNSDRAGVAALLDAAGMTGRRLTGTNVAFSLAPRINAAGRIGSPDRAVRLLLSEDPQEAKDLAQEIDGENRLRQQMEADILQKAQQILDENPAFAYDRVLVLAGEEWHKGVIGIVASKMVERYAKPCILISIEGDRAKGSGRSIEGFSLYDAVAACSIHLTRFGGHKLAAGLELEAGNVDEFRRAVNAYAAGLSTPMPLPKLTLDCKLRPASLSLEAVRDLHFLEPFGCENPAPLFGLFGMTLQSVTPLAGGKHVRLNLWRDNVQVQAVWFGMPAAELAFSQGEKLDLAVSLSISEYRGEQSLSVIVKDARPSGLKEEACTEGLRLYESLQRGEQCREEELAALCPNRDDMAGLFRYVRAQGGYRGSIDLLFHRLGLGSGKLLVALDALQELGIAAYENRAGQLDIRLLPTKGKVNLDDSAVLRELRQKRNAAGR